MSAPRITTRPHRIRTVGGLRKAAREVSSLWFSPETVAWFGTRFPDNTITYRPGDTAERGYFITSEQDTSGAPENSAWNGERRFTVRVFEITRAPEDEPATPDRIEVESASEFMEYATLDEARAALAFIAGVTR